MKDPKSSCYNCLGKGYLERTIAIHASYRTQIAQCPVCRNIAAYTRRVQELEQKQAQEPLTPHEFAAEAATLPSDPPDEVLRAIHASLLTQGRLKAVTTKDGCRVIPFPSH